MAVWICLHFLSSCFHFFSVFCLFFQLGVSENKNLNIMLALWSMVAIYCFEFSHDDKKNGFYATCSPRKNNGIFSVSFPSVGAAHLSIIPLKDLSFQNYRFKIYWFCSVRGILFTLTSKGIGFSAQK